MAPKPKGKPKGKPAPTPAAPTRQPVRHNGVLCWQDPDRPDLHTPLTVAELVEYQDKA